MSENSKTRIIFLDMMRALAVLMMVQGHTIDTFLADQYRDYSSTLFNIWFTIRGFTAPIFMFTSGVAFTYLLRMNRETFFENPRVKKGIIRFLTLLVIGYLLRYPTFTVFDFSVVTHEQWLGFFCVDALHLIGFGILFIMILTYVAEKIKVSDYIVFVTAALFFFSIVNFTEQVNWANYLPIPFAAYLYQGTGSYFPFFPWAGYVICGGILGVYLAHNPDAFTSTKFSFRLLIIGLSTLALAFLIEGIEDIFYKGKELWTDNFYVIFLRISAVVLLNSFMSFIALRIKTVPEFVKQVGRHTLLVYAVHVIILYGSAWVPGLNLIFSRRMDPFASIISAVIMIILMSLMVIYLEKYKAYKKNKIATADLSA
ncbi:MAG: heparan-alpha-glucosaminide N-acetyltransferase domain-containing protein [Bacteroidota bacterium]